MKDKTVRLVIAAFLLISAVCVVVAIVAVQNINRSIASSDWVNHTHAVISEADAIVSSLDAGDGALHTYLLTGDPRDLASCRDAFSTMTEHLEVAKALTRTELVQLEQIRRIAQLLDQRIAFTRDVVRLHQSNDSHGQHEALAGDATGDAVREIHRLAEKFKNDEKTLLMERDKALYLQAETTRWTVFSGVVLVFLLLGGAGWLVRDDIAARRRAAAALQEANEQLEAKVRERTGELVRINKLLSSENLERRWANQSLEHQLRYNQLIINSISDLVFVLTKGENITRINPAVVHLTGYTPEEIINTALARVVRLTPSDHGGASPAIDPIAQALKEGRDLQDRAAIVAGKTGHVTPVRFTLVALRDGNKVVGGVVTLQVIRDPASASA